MSKAYTTSEVMTGMCLWEAWQDMIMSDKPAKGEPVDATTERAVLIQEGVGSWCCREMMADAIIDCEAAWKVAEGLADDNFDGCFDWDFVPQWLRGAIESGRFD